MPTFSVNNKAVIQLTAKLERMHKSAFPSAVRNTLNNAAFDMKQKGILESARKNFTTVRSPSFFKRMTRVNKASGWNVNRMRSEAGFVNASDPSIRSAVEGMEKQEFGGIVNDGARYLKGARTSNSYDRKVRRKNYYDRSKVITGRNRGRGTRKSKFVSRMYRSKKSKKPFFMNTMRGNFLVEVRSIRRNKRSGKIKASLKFLMMSRDKTPVNISRTRFISKAAIKESKSLARNYEKNANYQFKKFTK
tara:strand:- start:3049 stop:3792 length:744 start_codon:yes stop_codon:yes gene_type:complete